LGGTVHNASIRVLGERRRVNVVAATGEDTITDQRGAGTCRRLQHVLHHGLRVVERYNSVQGKGEYQQLKKKG
jgi:hypothetical protein